MKYSRAIIKRVGQTKTAIVGYGRFQSLARACGWLERQRMAQIDQLIQAVVEKVVGHGDAFKNSKKTGAIEWRIHPI
jgi:hypothetical protein